MVHLTNQSEHIMFRVILPRAMVNPSEKLINVLQPGSGYTC